MQISIINHTSGKVSDEELQRVIRAINRQVKEDFEPYWGMSAKLRLEGRSVVDPNEIKNIDLRGDAVLYLWDKVDVEDALGYHDRNFKGIPFGFVFTELSQSIGEDWAVTFSHEVLELIADPETNLLVMGPHPAEDRDVFHWFEMCDAVQAESYEIDGVAVSNFLLPLYFTGTRDTDEVGARNDFLGRSYDGKTLKSFGINPGGYVGFYDPKKEKSDTFSIRGDSIALMRIKQKFRAKSARRALRYRKFEDRDKLRLPASEGGAKGLKTAARRGTALAVANVPTTPNGDRIYASVDAAVETSSATTSSNKPATRKRASAKKTHRPQEN